MIDLSISIVTFNNAGIIGATLESLLSRLPGDLTCRIFVIDNGSTDGTVEIVSRLSSPVNLIRSERGNIGFGAAHNLALPRLDSTVHVIMNPDITLADGRTLAILFSYLRDHPAVGMIVPRILNERGELQYLCRRHLTVSDLLIRFLPGQLFRKKEDFHQMKDHDYSQPFPVEFASGCLMAIRTDLLKALHGFDERFFLYAEDADLTRRVNQISRTLYVPDAVVIHKWERSSYKNLRLTLIHLTSLVRYFRKWGWSFK